MAQPQQTHPQMLLSGFGGEDHASPTQLLDEAAVEYEDDDYWDVQSDEDMVDAEYAEDENALLTTKEFNNIRRIHFENFTELGIRRYDAFLYDGLLSHYKPEYTASPLRNPKTARVFAHYIHVVSGIHSSGLFVFGIAGRSITYEVPITRLSFFIDIITITFTRPVQGTDHPNRQRLHYRSLNVTLETPLSYSKAPRPRLSKDYGHTSCP